MYLFNKSSIRYNLVPLAPRGQGWLRLQGERGFTFAECLLALVILGVALAPLLLCFPTGAKQGRLSRKMTVATDLAMDIMEEIKKMAFEDPDGSPVWGPEVDDVPPEDPNNRTTFDDVDDYENWKSSPPVDMAGGDLSSAFDNFTRQVDVMYVAEGDFNTDAGGATDFKRIKVTVSEEDIPDVEIVTVVTKY